MIRLLSYQPRHLSGPDTFPGTTKTLREAMTRFHEKEKEETCNIILQTLTVRFDHEENPVAMKEEYDLMTERRNQKENNY